MNAYEQGFMDKLAESGIVKRGGFTSEDISDIIKTHGARFEYGNQTADSIDPMQFSEIIGDLAYSTDGVSQVDAERYNRHITDLGDTEIATKDLPTLVEFLKNNPEEESQRTSSPEVEEMQRKLTTGELTFQDYLASI